MSKMKTDDEVEKILLEYGYKKDGTYSGANKPIKCIDSDGYVVYPTLTHLYGGKVPLRFHKSNPNTIDNIRHYIKINNINVELCSEEFIDAKSDLFFRCFCGNIYKTCWSCFVYGKKHQCNTCVFGQEDRSPTYDLVVERLTRNNLVPLFDKDEYRGICDTSGAVQNYCGYKAVFKSWFVEKQCEPEWFHKNNPYTIENINLFLKNDTNDEYVCTSADYVDENTELDILHKKCGTTFKAKWINLRRKSSEAEPNRHGTRCPYCTGLRTQSLHAVVLKQLFERLRDGTVLEDRSCINPLTNCAMPTDIVNHKDKIAIEVQSWWHDSEDRKTKDAIKKQYWESRGYTVYTPDIRNYSVLGMAQIFFPDLSEIPSWVQYDFENKLNVDIAQNLLNNGMSLVDVASEMGVTYGCVHSAIADRRLYYPSNYKSRIPVKTEYVSKNFEDPLCAIHNLAANGYHHK